LGCRKAMNKGSENPIWQRSSRSSPSKLIACTWRRGTAYNFNTNNGKRERRMRNPEKVLNILSVHSKELRYKYERLYRILFNEQMFYTAYQRIHAKPGNMTPGTDGRTIDQMGIERIEKLIADLKSEVYTPNPARRIYIPKKNGKLRPLGIPSFEDKLVQEVIRMILETIYEGHFEWTSHGFRPHKSCHTALKSLQNNFNGSKWFIEGDIKGFFDNIDHNVLIGIMKERIEDEKFLRLIRKFLKAGYMEECHFNNTYSGTPQGGIISPILANIYLDKFDKYMEEYAMRFKNGEVRQRNKEISKLNNRVHYLKKRLKEVDDAEKTASMAEELREKQKQILHMPSGNDMDKMFRRLKYVRYADDFLIGVIGTKDECKTIKADISKYMQEMLQLEMSDEKTLITNAQDHAKFLGYEIYVRKDYATKRNSNGTLRRYFNGNVVLHLPKEVIKKKLTALQTLKVETLKGKEVWKPTGRTYLIDNDLHEIVARYNTEIRGFYNYYSIANNASALGRSFGYIMEYSLYKTFAQKLNCSVREVMNKYRKDKVFATPYTGAKGETKYRVFYNEGFKRKTDLGTSKCDNLPYLFKTPSSSLAERLIESRCELCGENDKVVMHHVRKLSLLNGENEWERKMRKMHRKTLVVCERCNSKIQSGNS
jgi:group II intron reverse transcriptase/maturase